MNGVNKYWLMVVLISSSLFIHAQTQVGNDINGLGTGDNFGHSVSLSSDGTIVAASGFGGTSEDGRLRVFKNIGGVWTLYGTDMNGESFGGMGGFCVKLSDDGNTLAVGRWENVVRVFSYDSETSFWTQKGSDIINNTAISAFGNSIDMSSDGNTIVIGISGVEHPLLPTEGISQVFHFESGVWNQVGSNINGLVFPEHSGISVSMSSDGNTIAVSNNNSIRIYQNISGTWTLMGNEILTIGNSALKNDINLSSNGETIAIGEPYFDDMFVDQGQVRVFSYVSDSWTQVGTGILGEQSNYRTGWSVSLSSDGQVLAIGEIGSTSGSTDNGRTRIFENQGGSWNQIGTSIYGESSEDYSGWSVSLSSNASFVSIGASLNDGNGSDSGHVRIYDLSSLLSVNDLETTEIKLYPNPSKEQFNIQLPDGIELEKINIYSNLGELILSIKSSLVNTSNLSSGIYYVDIITNKSRVTKKLVLN